MLMRQSCYRGRICGLEVFWFIDVHISSKGNRPGPMNPVWIIPTFEVRHEVLRGSLASNRISAIFDGEKVDVSFVSRRQGCNPSDLRLEVVVGDLFSGNLIGCRQLNEVDWRPRGNYIVGVGPTRLAQLMVLLQLDHQVLFSNWGTLVPFVPKWNGTSKASKLMPSKEQIVLVSEEGCSIFK